jgi:hypothetical protein
MKHETEILRARGNGPADAPIARGPGAERRDRSPRVRPGKLLASPGEPIHEIRRVASELFGHRRELVGVQKELARLGCSLDAAHPGRILCARDDSEVSFEEHLDETGYRPDRSSPNA